MTITKTSAPIVPVNVMTLLEANRNIEKMLNTKMPVFIGGRFIHLDRSEKSRLRKIMHTNSLIIKTF